MNFFQTNRDLLDKRDFRASFPGFLEPRTTVLSADRVLVNATYRRMRNDGTFLMAAGAIYVMSRSSGAWKVCGILAQDFENFGKEGTQHNGLREAWGLLGHGSHTHDTNSVTRGFASPCVTSAQGRTLLTCAAASPRREEARTFIALRPSDTLEAVEVNAAPPLFRGLR